MKDNKKNYVAPKVRIVKALVEKGFAATGDAVSTSAYHQGRFNAKEVDQKLF